MCVSGVVGGGGGAGSFFAAFSLSPSLLPSLPLPPPPPVSYPLMQSEELKELIRMCAEIGNCGAGEGGEKKKNRNGGSEK